MRLPNWRRSVFVSARRRAGLSDRFRVHDLRHTAASLMIQAGYPPKMLQEIMGHASITTTLDLYGHLYPGEMDRYADRLNKAAGMTDAAKCGQTVPAMSSTRKVQRAELGRRWRARRDSNPSLLIRRYLSCRSALSGSVR
jgi:Phage integrase family